MEISGSIERGFDQKKTEWVDIYFQYDLGRSGHISRGIQFPCYKGMIGHLMKLKDEQADRLARTELTGSSKKYCVKITLRDSIYNKKTIVFSGVTAMSKNDFSWSIDRCIDKISLIMKIFKRSK